MGKAWNCNNIIIGLCIILGVIVIYSIKNTNSLIKNSIFDVIIKLKGGYFSIWTVSHFLFYMLLGKICPNNLLLIIVMGIMWELLELYFEYNKQVIQGKLLCRYINNCDNINKISNSEFWNTYFGINNNRKLYYCSGGYLGGIFDITANIFGYIIGTKI